MKQKIKGMLKPVLLPALKVYRSFRGRKTVELRDKFIEDIKNEIDTHNYDGVIIFDQYFGFNAKMYQRPQHIGLNLAECNMLYLYKSSATLDKDVVGYKKVKDNMYLVDLDLYWLQQSLLEVLNEYSDLKKFVQVYSTSFINFNEYLNKYRENKFKIIYEFVDDFSDEIARYKIPQEVKDSHEVILKDVDNAYIVTTADKLYEEVVAARGENKVVLATNGVSYDHFVNIPENIELSDEMKKILDKKTKIVGYFGALATWFDYELVKKLAKEMPEVDIVLIGIDYDNTLGKSGVLDYDNVHYLGIINYNELPAYAKHFDVATIPFVINEITEATSPVKLFEYMAMGEPIVTTNLPECKKYKTPLVSKDHSEFINNVKKAIELEEDSDYNKLLREEALENTWKKKAESIKELIINQ